MKILLQCEYMCISRSIMTLYGNQSMGTLCIYIYIHVQWGRLHFATFMCNINYKFIYYANLPFSYYSQFTVIIFFDNCVTGYITLLCMTIT